MTSAQAGPRGLPDATVSWVQVAGSREGRARHAGALRELTGGRYVETQTREHEPPNDPRAAQLRVLIERLPVPVAVFDRNMRYVAASRRYLEERHLNPAEVLGRTVFEVFPNIGAHFREAYARVLSGATQTGDAAPFLQRNGTHEVVRWAMQPWHRADGEIGGLMLFAELITERIQAQRNLRESQTRLELAVRAGSLGIYDFDLATEGLRWDARVRELFGVGADEPASYQDTFLAGVHPDDWAEIRRKVSQTVSAGSDTILYLEYRVINRRDQSIHWIASNGRVYGEGGQPLRLIGVVQDITARKRTELVLEQSLAELSRADENKNVFLATLSHELRNPLGPIRTAACLLGSPRLTREQLTWVSGVIGRQTAHLASLLDDLMEVTRISRGKLLLKQQDAPLAEIVQSAVEVARDLIDAKHHQLQIRLPEALTVHADPLRLSQVLANLLINAAKYTEPGGRIELEATTEAGRLVIRVRDNGIGMTSEALAQIFTLFWQAESGGCGGLGIGLAFVEGLVQLHGGTIEARSEGRGRGSEFIVRLPVLNTCGSLPPAPCPP